MGHDRLSGNDLPGVKTAFSEGNRVNSGNTKWRNPASCIQLMPIEGRTEKNSQFTHLRLNYGGYNNSSSFSA